MPDWYFPDPVATILFARTCGLGLIVSWHHVCSPYNISLPSPLLLESSLQMWKSYLLFPNLSSRVSLSAPPKRTFQSDKVIGETTRFAGGLQLSEMLKMRWKTIGVFWLNKRHACCKYRMQAINISILWFAPFFPWANTCFQQLWFFLSVGFPVLLWEILPLLVF